MLGNGVRLFDKIDQSKFSVDKVEAPGYKVDKVLELVYGITVRSRGLGGNIIAGLRTI